MRPPSRPLKPTVSMPNSLADASARFTLALLPRVEMPSAMSPYCASTLSCSTKVMEKSRSSAHRQVPPVGVVRGAGALRRNHGGPERCIWRALPPESGAVARLLDAPQNLPADADRGLVRLDVLDFEATLGVVIAVLPAQ